MAAKAELPLLSYYPVEVAPWLDPASIGFQAGDLQTSNPLEMVLHVGHVVHGIGLFEGPPLLLALKEVVEEPLLHLRPLPTGALGWL